MSILRRKAATRFADSMAESREVVRVCIVCFAVGTNSRRDGCYLCLSRKVRAEAGAGDEAIRRLKLVVKRVRASGEGLETVKVGV